MCPRTARRSGGPRLSLATVLSFAAVVGCERAPTSTSPPVNPVADVSAFRPEFPRALLTAGVSASAVVPFSRVRLLLTRADSTVAFDSTYDFDSVNDSLALRIGVRLGPAASAFGETLQLALAYINAEGDTVFRGGPATVVARLQTAEGGQSAPPVQVPVRYSGPGAHATSVRLSPHRLDVVAGDLFTFEARAGDARGSDVANAPIIYRSLNSVAAELLRFTSGVGRATGSRGTVGIVASLLTGAADTALLVIRPLAARLQVLSGGGQTGEPGAVLAQPIVARVVDATNVGVPDVEVHFRARAGGDVPASVVSTDAEGYARSTWRLGNKSGEQTLEVSSGKLLGSPFTVAATASSGRPPNDTSGHGGQGGGSADLSKAVMTIVSGDSQSARVRTALEMPLVVNVSDENGKPLADVAIKWRPVGQDGTASADSTITDATGRSSNKWTLGARAGVQSLKASLDRAGGVSVTFSATALSDAGAPPRQLRFVTEPSAATLGIALQPAVVVGAFDAQGRLDSTFVGRVSLDLGGTASAAIRLGGTTSATAVAGLAVFDRLQIDATADALVLVASATGLESATSKPFAVSNPPAALSLRSGDGQQAKPGTTLKKDLVVVVEDARHRGLAGITVTWRVLTGGGTIVATSTSDAQGQASAAWTLGSLLGAQSVSASVPDVLGSPVIFTATAKR